MLLSTTIRSTALLVAVVISAHTCVGQTEQQRHSQPLHSMSASTAVSNQVIIADGALDPSKIPDDIAFLHFFRVLAKDPGAASEQSDQARRVSYVKYFFTKGCGQSGQDDRSLNDTETAALLDYANRVSANLETINEPASGLSGISVPVSTAVLAAAEELDRALGPEVARKVRSHVTDHMKPAIKIVQSQISGPGK